MTATPQVPIGSGFHAKSTAKEVLDGIDLSGKNVVLTGGYSGIGIEAVRALAGAGAKVTVPARRQEAAADALGSVDGDVEIAPMDLGDIASVKKFASDYLDSGRALHLLINNAGIMACPLTRVGPGWESQFGVNHLGHMQLALGLLPALEKAGGARMVCLSSTAHIRGMCNGMIHILKTPNTKNGWHTRRQNRPTLCLLWALTCAGKTKAFEVSVFIPAGYLHRFSAIFPMRKWSRSGGRMLTAPFRP